MPSIGLPELIIIALAITVPAGIGCWCMVVFRDKGRSAGAGFAVGFLLTFLFSLVGAVAAVLIAYLSKPAAPAVAAMDVAGPPLPPPPPPPSTSTSSQVIGAFNATTGWDGRRILADQGGLKIDGVGPVSAEGVLAYVAQGQFDWASEAMAGWVNEQANREA